MKAIAPVIRSLDIKDFKWQNKPEDMIINTPLGEGVVDFEEYMALLAQYKVTGNMTMHFEYPLGGAEHGQATLNIKPAEVLTALKKDLHSLKGFLNH